MAMESEDSHFLPPPHSPSRRHSQKSDVASLRIFSSSSSSMSVSRSKEKENNKGKCQQKELQLPP